jgi:hypothetical protein
MAENAGECSRGQQQWLGMLLNAAEVGSNGLGMPSASA